MRPNIDLPWSVHGRVKDYAATHDVTLTEAYEELLDRGLDNPLQLTKQEETALYYHLLETLDMADLYEQQELASIIEKLPEYDVLQRDRPAAPEDAVEEMDQFDADVVEQEQVAEIVTNENENEGDANR